MSRFKKCYPMTMIVVLALASCAVSHPPAAKPLSPGTLYQGKLLSIRSPNETEWYRVKASRTRMQFNHHGTGEGESFSAKVFAFPLPKMENGKQFIKYLKKGFEKDATLAKYSIIKSSFRPSNKRKYRCVSASSVVQDKHALTSPIHNEKYLSESISLYCMHPVVKNAGFAIIYSHRGKALYSNMSKEARDFIAGVQVPGY